jgi:RNA polymerase sigma-70 factor (ECF subfamily)
MIMNDDGMGQDQTRRTLLDRLKNWDDQESWRQFFNLYWRLIYSVAIKAGLTETEAQDAVQETIISVAKTMPGFNYDPSVCSFKTWLRHLSRKRIIDQYRKRPPVGALPPSETSAGSRTDHMARIPDPKSVDLDQIWDTGWQKYVFESAVAKVRTQASAEQFQIFDFYVLRGWSASKVASTLGMSVARVYLARHRVMGLIKKEIQRLEKTGI